MRNVFWIYFVSLWIYAFDVDRKCGDFIQFIHKVNFPSLKIKWKCIILITYFFYILFSELNSRIFMIILDRIGIWLVIKCFSLTLFSLLLIHFKFSTLLHPTTISPPFAYSSSPSSEHFSISILCSLIQLSSARSTKNLISRFLYTPLGPKSIKNFLKV